MPDISSMEKAFRSRAKFFILVLLLNLNSALSNEEHVACSPSDINPKVDILDLSCLNQSRLDELYDGEEWCDECIEGIAPTTSEMGNFLSKYSNDVGRLFSKEEIKDNFFKKGEIELTKSFIDILSFENSIDLDDVADHFTCSVQDETEDLFSELQTCVKNEDDKENLLKLESQFKENQLKRIKDFKNEDQGCKSLSNINIVGTRNRLTAKEFEILQGFFREFLRKRKYAVMDEPTLDELEEAMGSYGNGVKDIIVSTVPLKIIFSRGGKDLRAMLDIFNSSSSYDDFFKEDDQRAKRIVAEGLSKDCKNKFQSLKTNLKQSYCSNINNPQSLPKLDINYNDFKDILLSNNKSENVINANVIGAIYCSSQSDDESSSKNPKDVDELIQKSLNLIPDKIRSNKNSFCSMSPGDREKKYCKSEDDRTSECLFVRKLNQVDKIEIENKKKRVAITASAGSDGSSVEKDSESSSKIFDILTTKVKNKPSQKKSFDIDTTTPDVADLNKDGESQEQKLVSRKAFQRAANTREGNALSSQASQNYASAPSSAYDEALSRNIDELSKEISDLKNREKGSSRGSTNSRKAINSDVKVGESRPIEDFQYEDSQQAYKDAGVMDFPRFVNPYQGLNTRFTTSGGSEKGSSASGGPVQNSQVTNNTSVSYGPSGDEPSEGEVNGAGASASNSGQRSVSAKPQGKLVASKDGLSLYSVNGDADLKSDKLEEGEAFEVVIEETGEVVKIFTEKVGNELVLVPEKEDPDLILKLINSPLMSSPLFKKYLVNHPNLFELLKKADKKEFEALQKSPAWAELLKARKARVENLNAKIRASKNN